MSRSDTDDDEERSNNPLGIDSITLEDVCFYHGGVDEPARMLAAGVAHARKYRPWADPQVLKKAELLSERLTKLRDELVDFYHDVVELEVQARVRRRP